MDKNKSSHKGDIINKFDKRNTFKKNIENLHKSIKKMSKSNNPEAGVLILNNYISEFFSAKVSVIAISISEILYYGDN